MDLLSRTQLLGRGLKSEERMTLSSNGLFTSSEGSDAIFRSGTLSDTVAERTGRPVRGAASSLLLKEKPPKRDRARLRSARPDDDPGVLLPESRGSTSASGDSSSREDAVPARFTRFRAPASPCGPLFLPPTNDRRGTPRRLPPCLRLPTSLPLSVRPSLSRLLFRPREERSRSGVCRFDRKRTGGVAFGVPTGEWAESPRTGVTEADPRL
mmetsp:Transcript_4713/g.13202  ORF Transcript_4713/g.13202 Transcript_4713/m.13202 type:complete len:211 (-) Transcript_4713:391-1023(-)